MTSSFLSDLDPITRQNIQAWSKPPFDLATKSHIDSLIEENPSSLIDAFYTSLSFGTGGLRGLMGIGTNRINSYTVSFVTEGLSRYLKKVFGEKNLRVFVGYDCRHNSKTFAEVSAKVLAGNGIEVFLADDLVATPFTSFACRALNCHAAIMVTASHNPKEYNGYKVYWQDGSQILSPHDRGIEDEAKKISSPEEVHLASLESPLIHLVGHELKQHYLDGLSKFQMLPKEAHEKGDKLKIVFANLHGTGSVYLPKLMKMWGFSNFHAVKEQYVPDGSFPTVHFPNPEDDSALALGAENLLALKGDLLIATDPDADRMRVGVRAGDEVVLLNGHEIACLLLNHILSHLEEIPSNGAVVKTIVTTELFKKIAESFGVECIDVLTGFKFIGKLIHDWEDGTKTFLFGGEESYGTLCGTLSRDKDGILGALLITEAAFAALLEGKTLLDKIEEIYQIHGRYDGDILCLSYPESRQGRLEMKEIMEQLRKHPPITIAQEEVDSIDDYLSRKKTDLKTGKEIPLTLPLSDVLVFHLKDGSKLIVRPSGTEPKIKIYGEVIGEKGRCKALLEAFTHILPSSVNLDF